MGLLQGTRLADEADRWPLQEVVPVLRGWCRSTRTERPLKVSEGRRPPAGERDDAGPGAGVAELGQFPVLAVERFPEPGDGGPEPGPCPRRVSNSSGNPASRCLPGSFLVRWRLLN